MPCEGELGRETYTAYCMPHTSFQECITIINWRNPAAEQDARRNGRPESFVADHGEEVEMSHYSSRERCSRGQLTDFMMGYCVLVAQVRQVGWQ